MREVRPDGLFQYLAEHEYSMSNPYKGIYYIEGKVLFPTQIVVTRELDEVSIGANKQIIEELRR